MGSTTQRVYDESLEELKKFIDDPDLPNVRSAADAIQHLLDTRKEIKENDQSEIIKCLEIELKAAQEKRVEERVERTKLLTKDTKAQVAEDNKEAKKYVADRTKEIAKINSNGKITSTQINAQKDILVQLIRKDLIKPDQKMIDKILDNSTKLISGKTEKDDDDEE